MDSEGYQRTPTSDFRKIFRRLLIIIVAGILAHIIFVLYTTEKDALPLLQQFKAVHVAAIWVLMNISWSLYALRILLWSSFLREKISFPAALRIVITSEIASAVSPTSVGGAPVKAGLLLQKKFTPGSVGFILTYGVMEDILFYSTGILLTLIFSGGLMMSTGKELAGQLVFYATEATIAVIFLIILFFLYKRGLFSSINFMHNIMPESAKNVIKKLKDNLAQGAADVRKNYAMVVSGGKKFMLGSFMLLLLQWAARFSILLVVLMAFKVKLPFLEIYLKQWIVQVMMLLVPTPGASGGAEASFLLVFGNSFPPDETYLIVSIWRLCSYYFILVTAMVSFMLIPAFTTCLTRYKARSFRFFS